MITKSELQEMIETNADNYANKYGVRTVDKTRRQKAYKAGADSLLPLLMKAVEILEEHKQVTLYYDVKNAPSWVSYKNTNIIKYLAEVEATVKSDA